MVRRGDPPQALRSHDQWVCWTYVERDGDLSKPPIAPSDGQRFAKTDDTDTWSSYATAKAYHDRSDTDTDGVGIMLTSTDRIAGADLDGCRHPVTGAVEPWARSVVDTLDSYTEISPSGTGLRVFLLGSLPEGGHRSEQPRTLEALRDVDKNAELELYDSDRYLTFTGDHFDGSPTRLRARSDELKSVHRGYVADDERSSSTVQSGPSMSASVDVTLGDRELLDKARNAANGKKFSRLYDRGDTSGYDSHSEADMALSSMLAFWTGGDHGQMDRLFRDSALMRPKWDESRGDRTYGELTIHNADRACSDYYTGATSDAVGIEPEVAVEDGGRPVVSMPTVTGVGEALADMGPSTTADIEAHPAVDRTARQVRRALRHLEETDVVASKPTGRTRTYRLVGER